MQFEEDNPANPPHATLMRYEVLTAMILQAVRLLEYDAVQFG